MKCTLLVTAILGCAFLTKGQPVFDVLQVQYQHSIPSSFLKQEDDEDARLDFFHSQLNLPVKLNPRNVLVFNPLFERRKIAFESTFPKAQRTVKNPAFQLQTLSFTVSHQYTLRDSSHQFLMAAAIRHAASTELHANHTTLRPAFALLYSQRESPHFSWKIGGYYSRELFGNLWLPLVGFDWKINEKLWCWGILPRYAVLDYAITSIWHTCLHYKGVTDSYRLPENDWFAIVEGQLRWSNDFYIPRTGWMATVDAGHSIARKFSSYDAASFSENNLSIADGFIFRVALSWRVVLNKNYHAPHGK